MDIVKMLDENNAYVNAKSKLGFTPLHLASAQGHVELITLLLGSRSQDDQLEMVGTKSLVRLVWLLLCLLFIR